MPVALLSSLTLPPAVMESSFRFGFFEVDATYCEAWREAGRGPPAVVPLLDIEIELAKAKATLC